MEPLNVNEANPRPRSLLRSRWKVLMLILITLIVVAIVAVIVVYTSKPPPVKKIVGQPPDPEQPLPPSNSVLRTFNKAAVCTDGKPCSKIGKEILEKNGSAVDAAIAALFCNGVVNMQSMGIGGGFLMTIYIKGENTAYTLNAREAAPAAATANMFGKENKKSQRGPLAVAVPGELAGYMEAHKRFGRLRWQDLIMPTVDLCRQGYNMTKAQYDSLNVAVMTKTDENLRTWFVDEKDQFKPRESLIKPLKLCDTLEMIALQGASEFYNGTMGKIIVKELQELGGIITEDDLRNYRAEWKSPISVDIPHGNYHMHTVGVPGGGSMLALIMQILNNYHFINDDIADTRSRIKTYHRIVEAMKLVFGQRGDLGDSYSSSDEFEKSVRQGSLEYPLYKKIDKTHTNNTARYYGVKTYFTNDNGTAHISVLAENGDAVSVTSTINLYFGAGFTSNRTGFVWNSCMDDFASPGFESYFRIPASQANAIRPGKRALSSMSPTIVTNSTGDVVLVIGASGGTRIITAVALVMMRILWFDQDIKTAVDAPRFHHQVFPMEMTYEYGIVNDVLQGLRSLGHKIERYSDRGSIVCAIYRNATVITANADFRKGGDVEGIN